MKNKVEEAGKQCSFKNYDVIQPKDDFCFEKRDWMSVRPNELPSGSKLIMGLNPPFGVKSAFANKFIDKALECRPKLLILIVPKETERLDEKDAYDLIWEDGSKLTGKNSSLESTKSLSAFRSLENPSRREISRPPTRSKSMLSALFVKHKSAKQRNLAP